MATKENKKRSLQRKENPLQERLKKVAPLPTWWPKELRSEIIRQSIAHHLGYR